MIIYFNFLAKNKIKFVNVELFKPLNLSLALFEKNDCIDADYSEPNVISITKLLSKQPVPVMNSQAQANEFFVELSEKCRFNEPVVGKNQISCLKHDCDDSRITTCCSFGASAVIDSPDFTILDRRHEGVTDVKMNRNTKIEYLPNSIFLKFSNVRSYNADRCAIREISKKNFDYLSKLKDLNLAYNRIQTIKRDTFEGIPSVKEINLSKFK